MDPKASLQPDSRQLTNAQRKGLFNVKVETWIIKARYNNEFDVDQTYEKRVEDIEFSLKPTEMLLKTLYVTVDPFLFGLHKILPLGEHAAGVSIMEVLDAGPEAPFRPGDIIEGFGGWRSHFVYGGGWYQRTTLRGLFEKPPYRLLNPAHYDDEILPISSALSAMGNSGLTAWGVMNKYFDVKPGHCFVISGATGPVGTLLGQLAKQAGAHVVGTTSTPAKIDYLKSLGFDHAILYNQGDGVDPSEALRQAAPNGIDKYFDNLGGSFTDAVFTMLNNHSQVAVSWQWDTFVNGGGNGPYLLGQIIQSSTTIRGIWAQNWVSQENYEKMNDELGSLIRRGEVKYDQTLFDGFDNIPSVHKRLFSGDRTKIRGKFIVKI